MKRSYKPLSERDLAAVTAEYSGYLADWRLAGRDLIVRSNALIVQQIGFQSLRYEAYRPSMALRLLGFEEVCCLQQLLSIKYKEVELRNHAASVGDVFSAMTREFRPDVLKPLDLSSTFDLLVAEKAIAPDAAIMSAVIAGYTGDLSQAEDDVLLALRLLSEPHRQARRTAIGGFAERLLQATRSGTISSLLNGR